MYKLAPSQIRTSCNLVGNIYFLRLILHLAISSNFYFDETQLGEIRFAIHNINGSTKLTV